MLYKKMFENLSDEQVSLKIARDSANDYSLCVDENSELVMRPSVYQRFRMADSDEERLLEMRVWQKSVRVDDRLLQQGEVMSFETVSMALADRLRGFDVEKLAYDPRWPEKAWALQWDGHTVALLRATSKGVACPMPSNLDKRARRQHVDAWLYRGDAVRELIEERESVGIPPSPALSPIFDREVLKRKLRAAAGDDKTRLAHDSATGPARFSLVLGTAGDVLLSPTGTGIFCDVDMSEDDDIELEWVVDGWLDREAAEQFYLRYSSRIMEMAAQYLSSKSGV